MNSYVSFISDEDFERCVSNLYDSYVEAHKAINEHKLYYNKLDVFKLTFDKAFKKLTDEDLLENEISRQIDKSINNAIGVFHEEMLGSIEGFIRGEHSKWDIKSEFDNSLFAEIKNKHNTMNSGGQKSVYQNLQEFAEDNNNATSYLVKVIAKNSKDKQWNGTFNGTYFNHPRVREISGDKFYALLSGVDDALYQVYAALPKVIEKVLRERKIKNSLHSQVTAVKTITEKATTANRSLLDQLAVDNFPYYKGFNEL